jgi:L-iditol 2-dehydrogenase
MKALLYYGPRDIRYEDKPIPEPGPGEVVIKVGAALTCGTDFKAYRQGHAILLGEGPSPFGHEVSGTVHALGNPAPSFQPGERVVAANSAPCDRCAACQRGESNLCETLVLHNGAYAEYMRIPRHIAKHNLHKIPPSLSFESAAMAEPLACVLRCLSKLGIREGDELAVIGTGKMGLLLIHVASRLGARVTAIGRTPEKLEAARVCGARETLVLSKPEDLPKPPGIGRESPFGFPLIVEAVGKTETWRLAIALAKKGARVCLYGGCAIGAEVPVDSYKIHYHELTLIGCFHHTPKDFSRAVEMLKNGEIQTELFIEEQVALSDLKSIFENQMMNPRKLAVIP